MSYLEETKHAMNDLAAHEEVLFIGQQVGCSGAPMFNSMAEIDPARRIEFPVAEDFQMGVSIGLALEGFCPVSVFPRMNFLILATNQLVNHLDKLPLYSAYRPKVIIRTAIGKFKPLDPGPQHRGNFKAALERMLNEIGVLMLDDASIVRMAYKGAYAANRSTIVIEDGNAC